MLSWLESFLFRLFLCACHLLLVGHNARHIALDWRFFLLARHRHMPLSFVVLDDLAFLQKSPENVCRVLVLEDFITLFDEFLLHYGQPSAQFLIFVFFANLLELELFHLSFRAFPFAAGLKQVDTSSVDG